MPETPEPRRAYHSNSDVRLFKFMGIGLGCAFLAGLVLLGVVLYFSL
ncbi:hypothetical protein [Hymenobacter actinosclerus]|uniref:Uncharacterized protein n=1 Tax=Hymenobacter actinosclerus TaxID=82805 RepID=A0A1I0BA88_9BACT|nr:hypothetical protein [Hymenobacter actinosclerus]SET03002.1 hypothetical protein SAMN04487998_0972 [Hymenobacter actinosclerus]